MSHNLMAILGTMVVDQHLRRTLTKSTTVDRVAALRSRGFFLSRGETEIFCKMMESFESGRLDEACMMIQTECPNWPCFWFTID